MGETLIWRSPKWHIQDEEDGCALSLTLRLYSVLHAAACTSLMAYSLTQNYPCNDRPRGKTQCVLRAILKSKRLSAFHTAYTRTLTNANSESPWSVVSSGFGHGFSSRIEVRCVSTHLYPVRVTRLLGLLMRLTRGTPGMRVLYFPTLAGNTSF